MFGGKAAGRWRLVPTRANGMPAFAIYQETGSGDFIPAGIQVLEIEAGKIKQATSFLDPALPERFGLRTPE